jgi:hypothetical protein
MIHVITRTEGSYCLKYVVVLISHSMKMVEYHLQMTYESFLSTPLHVTSSLLQSLLHKSCSNNVSH